MKKIAYILALMLLIINVANAGNIYPVDFSQLEEKTLSLSAKEGAEFLPFKGILILDSIGEDSVNMKLVLTDGKVWGTFPVKKLASTQVDIDRDNDNDLMVILNKIDNDKATLSFKEVRDDVKQTNIVEANLEDSNTKSDSVGKVTGNAVNTSGVSSRTIGILIILGILVVGVAGYFFFVKKGN